MKPLYWTRIILPNSTKGTLIWEETQDLSVDWDEFEELFCLKKGKIEEEKDESK